MVELQEAAEVAAYFTTMHNMDRRARSSLGSRDDQRSVMEF